MKCFQCGGRMKSARENVRYEACGLPGITLLNVKVSRCAACGEFEVAIPNVEDLHRRIAQAVIHKPARLTPAEVRFLRKYLGWSGVDFATHAGVAPETVSRWEQGGIAMGPTAERFLRLCVATREPVADYSLKVLKEIVSGTPQPVRLGARIRQKKWQVRAA